MARLLICRSCGTVNRLRDYLGDPGNDWELKDTIDAHLGKATDPRPEEHPSQLMLVDDDDIDKMDEQTLKKAIENEMDVELKEMREDYKDQAMQCYQLHARPAGGCSDWCHESRVIGRKAGVPPTERAYLCYYCPVSVWVENRKNEKSGMFKKHKWS